MSLKLNVLIIGSGGREHALAWKIAQSDQVKQIWVAPGNAGTSIEPKVANVELAVTDVEGLIKFAKEKNINLVVVGPEMALAAGVTDAFSLAQIPCFGPTRYVAQLETSKVFSKAFMQELHIPTAKYACFSNKQSAWNYLLNVSYPIVIKADGLAAGKGVIIAQTINEAKETVAAILEKKRFGEAGNQVVIEEFLEGTEMSFIVMTDGEHILPLASSKDHKRRDDFDQGPNTGGMGAFSPAPQITPQLEKTILNDIIQPVIDGFNRMGKPYVGFLYAGLMINKEGKPLTLEFNCRLGDPETQPILMRLQTDLIDLILDALSGKLDQTRIAWDSRPALTVVLAAAGYPDSYETGKTLNLPSSISANPIDKVFHAGTKNNHEVVMTNGGRVLAVTALGNDLTDARKNAYSLVKKVVWADCLYRTDIGI